MNIIDSLNWRYATKKFDPTKKVSEKDLNELLEVLRLAPSSFGLQPWTFIIVENKELRQQLQQHAWGQTQVTDASHLIILTAKTTLDEAYIKKYVAEIAKTRKIPPEHLTSYQDLMLNHAKHLTPEQVIDWNKHQVYIALGMLLTAAALKKIDACPMEGFDAKHFDKLLELKGHTTTVLCPIGYRAADDKNLPKVRFSKKDIITTT